MKENIKNAVRTLSWSLYDFANTIFAMNVISLYFALWVTVDKGAEDILYSIVLSGSLALSAIIAPVAGAISDRLRRRKPFLIFFTLLCVIFTALLGAAGTLWQGLFLFAIANLGYQLGAVFYDTLLPQVTAQRALGRVSGLGVAFGYLGTITGLMMVRPFVKLWGRQAAFAPTAALFLLFAAPCFIIVREMPGAPVKFRMGIRAAIQKILYTLGHLRERPAHRRYFLAMFLCMISVNTLIIFMSVYAKKGFGLTDAQLFYLLLGSSVFAVAGALLSGFLSDKFGARRVLLGTLWLWCLLFFLAFTGKRKEMLWVIGPLAGISLGSTWASSRAFLIEIAHPGELGEFFGICALIGRIASVVGPILWGIVILSFRPLGAFKYHAGALLLFSFMLAGTIIVQRMKMKSVLFVCAENSCRSQMAEGFARHYGAGILEVYSAGSRPATELQPDAVAVMKERSVDISLQNPKGFGDLPKRHFDCVVTMGCGDACPYAPAGARVEWDVFDPKGKSLDEFRAVRDDIDARVKELIARIRGWGAKDHE